MNAKNRLEIRKANHNWSHVKFDDAFEHEETEHNEAIKVNSNSKATGMMNRTIERFEYRTQSQGMYQRAAAIIGDCDSIKHDVGIVCRWSEEVDGLKEMEKKRYLPQQPPLLRCFGALPFCSPSFMLSCFGGVSVFSESPLSFMARSRFIICRLHMAKLS